MLCALNKINNLSLGGKSTNSSMTKKRKKVLGKSETLKMQSQEINIIAKKQVNKLIAFYSDYDLFLMSYDVVCITLELSSIDAPPTVLCVLFVLFITSFFAAIRQHANYDFISASFNLMYLSL